MSGVSPVDMVLGYVPLWSLAYSSRAVFMVFRSDILTASLALSLALLRLTNMMLESSPMIAMTTRSSMRVKARLREDFE